MKTKYIICEIKKMYMGIKIKCGLLKEQIDDILNMKIGGGRK